MPRAPAHTGARLLPAAGAALAGAALAGVAGAGADDDEAEDDEAADGVACSQAAHQLVFDMYLAT